MNKIVFELCAEDRARLDDIIAGLAALVPSGAMPEAAEALAEKHPLDAPINHLEPPVAAPAARVPDPAPVEPAPEVKPVPLGEFQKAIATRCAESVAVKEKVRALVHKYAPSVGEIPEGKRPEVLAALAKL